MPYKVQDIANKIILSTDFEKGDTISNLKLQKLLYYVQGYSLAFFDKVMFSSEIEAWTYGPVVPEVYHRFKDNKSFVLYLDPKEVDEIELNNDEQDMFNQVMDEYGKFSAIKLMEMTHQELPWKEAFDKSGDTVIKTTTMTNFFKSLVDG